MESFDWHDLLSNAAFFIICLVAGVGAYLRRPKAEPTRDAAIAAVGAGWGDREQMERLIKAVEAVAAAISDEKQDAMEDKLNHLVERLDEVIPHGRRRRE